MVAAGVGAVVTMSGSAVTVLTGEQEWRARLDGSLPGLPGQPGQPGAGPPGQPEPGPRMSRDALVAGFVPGVTLGWSWPDSLRHAVSLAATAGLSGRVDLVTYERLLPEVVVETVVGAKAQAQGAP